METPISIEMNDRKTNIAKLVYDAKGNNNIDNDHIIKLFDIASKEIEYYKYFGDNTRINDFMNNELINNSNGLKEFLEGTYEGVQLNYVILSYLK